ncbi:UNVERIFIED_CONTAM: Abscisic acid 8'-hydroxylase 3 [Sesamum latifolium]|uniref:Abscisic acid 8'-hydroxylase 3 n=1 Tax=Sesamum latifolium TaxID=2727402 RepID=A0AAW2UI76_9LAMI
MEMATGFWVALLVGILAVVGWLLWWWNDILYALRRLRRAGGGAKLPPGYMGIPFLGEMLTFLWYFKILGRPDDFINSKRCKYGDGVGLYRTHLFGSPAIIACTPSANKFVLQTESSFFLEWPSVELVGTTSLVAVQGSSHTRVRSFVVRAINQPDALRKIALMVQPRIIVALESWAQKGRIRVYKEAKKVTFANIGKYFASFEPGLVLDTLDELFKGLTAGFRAYPLNFPGTAFHRALQVTFANIGKYFASLEPGLVLDTLDELFECLTAGFRAYPLNFPGTAFHRALQCRKKAMAIFRDEMEKRKKCDTSKGKNDLMEGLMQMKDDDDGEQLTETEVLDNIVSLVVAGYTSTSVAIMWAFYYLAMHPNVVEKLREEHMPITKKLNGEFITYDEVSSCKYTGKVVEEIIRLANIATFIFRTAKTDVEYKGYIIPKGWKVVCWLRYLHTNPENFEDPMCFNPDRWNEPPKPGSYLVFGGGSRICAGNMLVRLQVAVLLHHLVVGYRWELVNPNAKMSHLPYPKPADEVEGDIHRI